MNFKLFLLVIFVGVAIPKPFDWKSKTGGLLNKIKKSATHVLGVKKVYKEGRPWFCHDLDCPEFVTKKKFGKFEERCYPKSMWVMTAMQGKHGEEQSFEPMFKKLFKYITGANEKAMEIKMTAPVLVDIYFDRKDQNVTYYYMSFFVPPTQVDNLPQPTEKDVSLVAYDERCVYVMSFGKWMMSMNSETIKKVNELKSYIKKEGLEDTVQDGGMIFAGYDSSFRLFNSHNEVMVMKKAPKKTATVKV